MLNMSLSQFIADYIGMTDIQRKDFQKTSIGLWVNWTGTVENVFEGGTVYMVDNVSNTSISLLDIPIGIQKSLSKGQIIHFKGQLDTVEYFSFLSNLAIVVRNVQINP